MESAVSFEKLIEQFKAMPGIGAKTAMRLAFHVLSLTKEEAYGFADVIKEAADKIHRCPQCANLTDEELCPVCKNPARKHSVICVVENVEASEEARAEAAEKISRIAVDIQNEANIETLVKAKGFEACVAVISEDSVSVVVAAESLQATEVAQIMSIVYETTGISPENVSVVQK